MRKEIAELLRNGKQEYARIRVEGVIRENLLMKVRAASLSCRNVPGDHHMGTHEPLTPLLG